VHSSVFVRAVGTTMREGITPECPDQPGHASQVLVRKRPSPSRHWIRSKC